MQTPRAGGLSLVLLITCAAVSNAAPLVVEPGRGAVASDNAQASKAGAEILARGGNAVDAAVATALALGVVSPAGSGLGGGGFAVVWSAKLKRARVIDFRETAPAKASRDMYLVNGRADPEKSRSGGLAVAVPGEPAGLAALEKELGKLGLAKSAAPAIKLAGFELPVSESLGRAVDALLGRRPLPKLDPDLVWLVHEIERSVIPRRKALPWTLETFANGGADAFYR